MEEERKRIQTDSEQGRQGGTPSYNLKDVEGNQPVFKTSSSRIVEMLLQFDDLEVTRGDRKPFLWGCAERGLVSETVAERLREQIGQRFLDTLPLEEGENVMYNWKISKWQFIDKAFRGLI